MLEDDLSDSAENILQISESEILHQTLAIEFLKKQN